MCCRMLYFYSFKSCSVHNMCFPVWLLGVDVSQNCAMNSSSVGSRLLLSRNTTQASNGGGAKMNVKHNLHERSQVDLSSHPLSRYAHIAKFILSARM